MCITKFQLKKSVPFQWLCDIKYPLEQEFNPSLSYAHSAAQYNEWKLQQIQLLIQIYPALFSLSDNGEPIRTV